MTDVLLLVLLVFVVIPLMTYIWSILLKMRLWRKQQQHRKVLPQGITHWRSIWSFTKYTVHGDRPAMVFIPCKPSVVITSVDQWRRFVRKYKLVMVSG